MRVDLSHTLKLNLPPFHKEEGGILQGRTSRFQGILNVGGWVTDLTVYSHLISDLHGFCFRICICSGTLIS